MWTIDTGTATRGMRVVRTLPRNKKTTIATKIIAITSVRMTSSMIGVTKPASKNTHRPSRWEIAQTARSWYAISLTSTAFDPGD
jgi:hypothetical protein